MRARTCRLEFEPIYVSGFDPKTSRLFGLAFNEAL